MNSINKNQPEKNHENLSTDQALKKVKELIEQAETCFFSTQVSSGDSMGTRPMTIQQVDDQGVLWILSASDSHTNQEIAANPEVKLYFQGSAHSDFLYLHAQATILNDKAKIKELWKPILKTWFTEGESDPRISVLKIEPSAGYYWDNKHGNAIAGIKMLIGAAIGKTLDDSIEGKLHV